MLFQVRKEEDGDGLFQAVSPKHNSIHWRNNRDIQSYIGTRPVLYIADMPYMQSPAGSSEPSYTLSEVSTYDAHHKNCEAEHQLGGL